MTSTTTAPPRPTVGGPRHGVFLTLMALIALWAVPQLVAVSAVTGLPLVIPTLLAVLGLLIAPESRPAPPGPGLP